jgi:hypothetical protein
MSNNVTMNNVVNKLTNNVTMNNVKYTKIKINQVDFIADKLVKELGNEDYRTFYCKVAYKLPESIIWTSLELALKGREPAKYFTWLVKKELSK